MWNATFESKAESNQSRIFDCISRRKGESRRWNLSWFKRRINTSGGLSGSKFSFPVLSSAVVLFCCFCYDAFSFCFNILSFCSSGLMWSYAILFTIVLFCCFVMLFCLSFCYELNSVVLLVWLFSLVPAWCSVIWFCCAVRLFCFDLLNCYAVWSLSFTIVYRFVLLTHSKREN